MPFRLTMGSIVSTNNNTNAVLHSPNLTKSRRKAALVELQRELMARDELLSKKDTELIKLRDELTNRDKEIMKLQKRVHELDCVVQQTSSKAIVDELPRILEEKAPLMRNNSRKWKRKAVSGESSSNIRRQESNRELLKFSKDLRQVNN